MSAERRFTGRQITTMVVAVSLALAISPVGAMAASGAFTSIADPSKPANKAHVNAKGGLAVTPQDAKTGVAAKIDKNGNQLVAGSVAVTSPVTVANPVTDVTTTPAYPTTPFASYGSPSVTVPSDKHLVVETLSLQLDAINNVGMEGFVHYTSNGVASELFVSAPYVYRDASTGYYFYATTVPVKLYADPGTTIWVDGYGGSGSLGTLFVSVSGYLQ